jgi:hypothetical protein
VKLVQGEISYSCFPNNEVFTTHTTIYDSPHDESGLDIDLTWQDRVEVVFDVRDPETGEHQTEEAQTQDDL